MAGIHVASSLFVNYFPAVTFAWPVELELLGPGTLQGANSPDRNNIERPCSIGYVSSYTRNALRLAFEMSAGFGRCKKGVAGLNREQTPGGKNRGQSISIKLFG